MQDDNRRKALKALAVAAPAVWSKPVVDSVILPSHASMTIMPSSGASGDFMNASIIQKSNQGALIANVLEAVIPEAHAICPSYKAHLCVTPNASGSMADVDGILDNGGSSSYSFSGTDIPVDGSSKPLIVSLCPPAAASILDRLNPIQQAYAAGATLKIVLDSVVNGAKGKVEVSDGGCAGDLEFDLDIGPCDLPECVSDCFLSGTEILLADGNIKAIETLTVGDQLASYDFSSDKVIPSPVDKLHRGEAESYLNIDGIQVTDMHPFAVGRDDWLEASNLKPKQELVTLNGPKLIEGIQRVHQPTPIYNMSVANTHNYYVKSGEKYILVHNKV